MMIGHVLE